MACFRYFLYGVILSFLFYSLPVQASYSCGKFQDALTILFKNGYGALAAAELDNGSAIMIFIKPSGKFKIIGVDENKNACELITGFHIKFFIERGA